MKSFKKKLTKKIKKMAILLCAGSTFIPSVTNITKATTYSATENFREFNVCRHPHPIFTSNNGNKRGKPKHRRNQVLRDLDDSMEGYVEKKVAGTNEQVITGKVKLIPVAEKYRADWNRIMDCTDDKGKTYLKWWTAQENLTNEYMNKRFDSAIKSMKKKRPPRLTFMIEFTEFENPVKKDELTKAKLKEPKIAGQITLSCHEKYPVCSDKVLEKLDEKKPESESDEVQIYHAQRYKFKDTGEYVLGYVVDKDCQGKGIGTKALELGTKVGTQLYLMGVYNIKKINLYIACDNEGSKRVAKKCGFTDVGSVPKETTYNMEAHKWEKDIKENRMLYMIKSSMMSKMLSSPDYKELFVDGKEAYEEFKNCILPCPAEKLQELKKEFLQHDLCERLKGKSGEEKETWINSKVMEKDFDVITFREWEEKFRSTTMTRKLVSNTIPAAVDPIIESNDNCKREICDRIDKLLNVGDVSEEDERENSRILISRIMNSLDFPVAWYHKETGAIFPALSEKMNQKLVSQFAVLAAVELNENGKKCPC